jgi:AcrR family transcriptional regulator
VTFTPSDVPKKDEILRAGRSLLLRHGIRKVRVEEICSDAGVSKRTFYKYFHNKDDLAIAVLGDLFSQSRARLEAVLDLDSTLEEKVQQIMEVKSRLASETSATFYRDVLDESTEPGRYALQEQRKWDQRVRIFYIDAQRHGQIRGDIDIDVLMALFARSRELVADPELLRLVPDFGRLVETAMTVFFYGVVPRPVTGRRRARSGTRRNET